MTSTPELSPKYPARPCYTYGDGLEFLAAMADWRADVEEFNEAATGADLDAGRAIYDRIVAAEVLGKEAVATFKSTSPTQWVPNHLQQTVDITLAEFSAFRAWGKANGIAVEPLSSIQQFHWFDVVLVVVR